MLLDKWTIKQVIFKVYILLASVSLLFKYVI